MKKVCLSLLLCFIALGFLSACDQQDEKSGTEKAAAAAAAYLCSTVTEPTFGSVGGDWVVIGLARSDYDVPEGYFNTYYDNVVAYVKDCGGILDQSKNSEYSRLILALTAIGKDPADVAGYNMLMPLADFEKTSLQGINGPIWALLALDSGNYEIPQNSDAASQATRDLYIEAILSCQLANGGFSFTSGMEDADADITAMALTALSNYVDRSEVAAAVEKALGCLSSMQQEDGGFRFDEQESAETDAQVLVALASLGIGRDDVRFIKNNVTVADHLLTFALSDGSFAHMLPADGPDQMATEQAFYALVALERSENELSPLYRMAE
ncbi:MAG TPA: terpene cyclase/mutase family protein [Clostridiales bacterium]|nr:terpene cyclase/mutase family protein [Clostridiales bacterium]